MATPTSSGSFASLKRYDEYFLPGGDLFLVVEHFVFRVHRYFFERESLYFKGNLATPASPGLARQGTTETNAILLEDVSAHEFARFLWVFYNPQYSLYDASVEDWTAILTLAHRWSFPEVKSLATRELEKLDMSDIDRIVVYHNSDVDRNLLIPRYAALCEREDPLTVPEGYRLGLETAMIIATAREVSRRATRDLHSPTTSNFHGTELFGIVRELFAIPVPEDDAALVTPSASGGPSPISVPLSTRTQPTASQPAASQPAVNQPTVNQPTAATPKTQVQAPTNPTPSHPTPSHPSPPPSVPRQATVPAKSPPTPPLDVPPPIPPKPTERLQVQTEGLQVQTNLPKAQQVPKVKQQQTPNPARPQTPSQETTDTNSKGPKTAAQKKAEKKARNVKKKEEGTGSQTPKGDGVAVPDAVQQQEPVTGKGDEQEAAVMEDKPKEGEPQGETKADENDSRGELGEERQKDGQEEDKEKQEIQGGNGQDSQGDQKEIVVGNGNEEGKDGEVNDEKSREQNGAGPSDPAMPATDVQHPPQVVQDQGTGVGDSTVTPTPIAQPGADKNDKTNPRITPTSPTSSTVDKLKASLRKHDYLKSPMEKATRGGLLDEWLSF